nr:serine acetyltransferase [Vibrio anguillarum]
MLFSDYKINSFVSGTTLFIYRFEHLAWKKNRVMLLLIRLVTYCIRRILGINSQISYQCAIGRRVRLPHRGDGVIISKYASIGNGVTIFQQVTIGINESKDEKNKKIIIGDGCYISSGAK